MTAGLRFDALVDARGLSCPMPLVKARQALMVLPSQAVICVLATDPAAPRDFEEFCFESGHVLADSVEIEGIFRITVHKK